jgi:cell wall assembly regulator SMI1
MSDLRHVWQRIAQWHQENLPEALRDGGRQQEFLSVGASGGELTDAEQVMGLVLPADIRESYRLHDGSQNGYAILPWGYHLLSLAGVVASWRMWQSHVAEGMWVEVATDPEGPIRPVHWNHRWVPISHNNGGDHQCVDLDPAPGGKAGQVIAFNHEVGPVRVLADGFGAWLGAYAAGLEAGRYRYDSEELWVVPLRQA